MALLDLPNCMHCIPIRRVIMKATEPREKMLRKKMLRILPPSIISMTFTLIHSRSRVNTQATTVTELFLLDASL